MAVSLRENFIEEVMRVQNKLEYSTDILFRDIVYRYSRISSFWGALAAKGLKQILRSG